MLPIENRRDLVAQDNGEKFYNVLSKSNVLFENGRLITTYK